MGLRVGSGVVWVAAAVLVAQGCRGQAQSTGDPAESQERLNVISNPSMYLDTGEFAFDEEADDYEQLLAMTVWNKSRFAVQGLEGDVVWLDDDGRRIGTSHFSLAGAVPARGSKTFSSSDGTMTAGTLRGGALKVTITFTHVSVAE